MDIFVENIKCGGCVNSIKTALLKIQGVHAVEIDKEADKVCLEGEEGVSREEVVKKLMALGYPEKGHNSLVSMAKSVVSCAVGRMSDKAE